AVGKGELAVNVADYGAVLDGVTDDSAAWAAAMAAVAPGGRIRIPYGTLTNTTSTKLLVTKRVTIEGHGAAIKVTNINLAGLAVSADGVTILGLHFEGPNATAYSANSRAIEAIGQSATTRLSRLSLLNCTFANWRACALWGQWVDRVKVIDCDVTSTAYGGFVFLSASNSEVRGGTIANINFVAPQNVAYGIVFTHLTAGGLEAHPRSTNCKAIGVTIDGCNWEALDTHSGDGIVFSGNIMRNCTRGIVAVPTASLGTGPLRVTITGNTIDSGRSDGGAQSGIIVRGSADGSGVVQEYATGTINGNTVIGHGGAEGDTLGGVSFYYTRGMAVEGNTVQGSSGAGGIVPFRDNEGFVVANNTIVDVWSNTYGGVAGVHLRSLNNKGFIGGNNMSAAGKTATHVNLFGLRCSVATGTVVKVGLNDFRAAATKYLSLPAGTEFAAVTTTAPTT
ncbi:MAG: right-handed parallel beta-helix repeat-containing protein, partial [Dietzia sp.]|nr:right-handed parallel beta-helix repeat-containing protein [Dietzia sp.]